MDNNELGADLNGNWVQNVKFGFMEGSTGTNYIRQARKIQKRKELDNGY